MVMVAESAVFHDRQAPMATVTVILLLGGRRRPGRCRGCAYDITASLDFGRCSECGRCIANEESVQPDVV